MPEFLKELPQADLALLCVSVTVGVTWLGVLFVKPLLRLLVGGEANVNATIGYATSVFSLFYGLLVGLLAVAAYQNAEAVERAAFNEAASVSSLYADAASYPDPMRSELREMLRDYVLYTVLKDWPAHARGEILLGGAHRADAMRQRLAGFSPATPSQDILHRQVTQVFHEFSRARDARLGGVLTRIPEVLWYAVIAGAAVNIAFLLMLKIRPAPHLVLGGLVSFFLGVMLFVIIALDDPLRGDGGLQPEAMSALWETRMVFDEPQV